MLILTLSCTDRPGIVGAVGTFLAEQRCCAVPVVGEARARSILASLWGIERVQSLREWLA